MAVVLAATLAASLSACGPDGEDSVGDRPVLVRADSTPSARGPAGPETAGFTPGPEVPDTAWGRLVAELSESGGFFESDNLISNEASYLHVLGALERRGVRGGAYIGVGPDQNFSYIAAIRPEIAFIVDIRADNVLQHLLFRTLFELAPTRVEYLALLHGRALPENTSEWWDASAEELVQYVREARGGLGSPEAQRAIELVQARVGEQGIELTEEQRETIRRFHREFIRWGMDLRYSSSGLQPRPFYPTYEELLTETDLEGRPGSFVADRDDYLWLREMQAAGRIVPVVGDFAGDEALRAIGAEIRARGLTVSAFYTSNVEAFLWSGVSLGAWFENLRRLPTDDRSVIIRSYFPEQGQTGLEHPHAVQGYVSTQTLQPLRILQEDGIQNLLRSYYDLATYEAIDPRGNE